mmetsp:Transcript_17132/g.49156  ORF Transcript_17132/g.49156 Transcript_17132/m.49156 type:complete len:223 (-) Transcript_17132:498-1166(-)
MTAPKLLLLLLGARTPASLSFIFTNELRTGTSTGTSNSTSTSAGGVERASSSMSASRAPIHRASSSSLTSVRRSDTSCFSRTFSDRASPSWVWRTAHLDWCRADDLAVRSWVVWRFRIWDCSRTISDWSVRIWSCSMLLLVFVVFVVVAVVAVVVGVDVVLVVDGFDAVGVASFVVSLCAFRRGVVPTRPPASARLGRLAIRLPMLARIGGEAVEAISVSSS